MFVSLSIQVLSCTFYYCILVIVLLAATLSCQANEKTTFPFSLLQLPSKTPQILSMILLCTIRCVFITPRALELFNSSRVQLQWILYLPEHKGSASSTFLLLLLVVVALILYKRCPLICGGPLRVAGHERPASLVTSLSSLKFH